MTHVSKDIVVPCLVQCCRALIAMLWPREHGSGACIADLATHATPHPALRFAEFGASAAGIDARDWREYASSLVSCFPRYDDAGKIVHNSTGLLVSRGQAEVHSSAQRHGRYHLSCESARQHSLGFGGCAFARIDIAC